MRNKIWKEKNGLWWKGVFFHRRAKSYQKLLDRAFTALYNNDEFRKCLEEAGDVYFTHKIGKHHYTETVLTESEFIRRLNGLKQNKSL